MVVPLVMTSNICQPWKLFNGAAGTVTDIIFEPGDCPRLDGTAWPRMVLVDFPQYTGPAFLPDRPTVVPVFPKEVSDSKRGGTRDVSDPVRILSHVSQGLYRCILPRRHHPLLRVCVITD